MLFQKKQLTYKVFFLLLLYPPFISVVLSIAGIRFPSYLFCMLLSIPLILTLASRYITFYNINNKLIFYTLFLWIIYGMTYSISVYASKDKVINILYTIITPSILLGITCNFYNKYLEHYSENDNFSLKLKLNSTFLIYAFLILIIFTGKSVDSRIVLPGLDNPIWVTRFLGLNSLILILSVKNKYQAWDIITIFIGIGLMILVGSRTPIISLVICLFLYSLRTSSWWKNLLFIILGVGLIFLSSLLFSDSYLFSGGLFSIYDRIQLFNVLQNINVNKFFGAGTGSFGLLFFDMDIEAYPHNIFVELFIENGFVGLFLFIFLLFLFFKRFSYDLTDFMVLYTFINSLTSGDIVGNNIFFLLLFFSLSINKNKYEKRIVHTP